jgi:protein phosphatase 1 regulatory subunit 7
MSIMNSDGFRFFDEVSNDILVEEDRLEQYVDYINKKNIKYVTISLFWGYTRRDIDFISKCPDIEYLELMSPLINDFSPVNSLKHLKWLRLDNPKSSVDLAHLPALEELYIDHHKHIISLDKCTNLRKLDTSFYNPLSKNLEEIANLENLTSLRIYRSNVDSLKGLGNLKRLEHVLLHNFSNLHHLDELEKISDSLTVLVFAGCKRIENFEYLAHLKKLKVLKFDNCGNIPNIRFIKQMPYLKAFAFVDATIVDGDLSPCIGLEYVGFFNKKHYSHKFEDFPNNKSSPEIHALLQLH